MATSSRPLPASSSPWRQPTLLAALAVLNLAGGLLMQWYVLGTLGPGSDTDALFASLALPQALLYIIASSFMNVLVPLLAGEDDVAFRQKAWTFAAVTFGVFAVLSAGLAVVAPWWVPVLAPGLTGSVRELAVQLARIQLLGMLATSMAGILGAVNRARHAFVWAEGAPLLAMVVSAAVLVLTLPVYGVFAAAWAQVLRLALHALLLSAGLGRFAGFDGNRQTLTSAWQRLRPLLLGTAYFRTEPVYDRAVSSLAPAGDLSLFYVCQQVAVAAIQLANNALIAPLSPVLAVRVRHGDWQGFDETRRRSVRLVLRLSLCAAAAMLVALAAATVSGILPPAAQRTAWVMALLAGVVVAGPVAESLRAASIATAQTARAVRVDVAVYTTGLVLKAAGFLAFGVFGLALAASLQHLLSAVALTRSLNGLVRSHLTSSGEPR